MRAPPWLYLTLALICPACGFHAAARGSDGGAPDLGGLDLGFALGLSGSAAVSASTIDLTNEGTRDWAHWGYQQPSAVDRKALATSLLPNQIPIGAGALQTYTNDSVIYTWSDGAEHPTLSTSGGIYQLGTDGGFTLDIPADPAGQTLLLYVGGYKSRGELHATLSDAPDQAYDDASFSGDNDLEYNATYTVHFRAASPGQRLSIVWRAQSTSAADGNVTLQAAALR